MLAADFPQFLDGQSRLNARANFDAAVPQLQTRLLSVPAAEPRKQAAQGTVELPAAKLDLLIEMRMRIL